jgi:hypothetical protein
MRKVERAEILDLPTYEGIRDRFRGRIIALKKRRRVAAGPHMTLVFENRDTMLFQIQEMLRTERITREPGIAHEIETYNDLVPDQDELSATLFIEYDDKEERAAMLRKLADLRGHVHLQLGDVRCTARFSRVDGEEEGRLPAVNYLRFPVPASAARALVQPMSVRQVVVDHPAYGATAELAPATCRELATDLAEP